MLNKILVSIDGSPLSFKALEFAMGLGKGCGSEIVVLHVAVPFDLSKMHSFELEKLDDDALDKVLKKSAEAEMTASEQQKAGEGALDAAKAKAAGAGYTNIEFKEVVDTEPAKTIIKQAEILGSEAIVVGSSGLGGLSSLFLGSVSSKVIANAHCPVIVVR